MFEIAKEMHLDEKALGKKNVRDEGLIRLLKSPVVLTSGFSTVFFTRKSQGAIR